MSSFEWHKEKNNIHDRFFFYGNVRHVILKCSQGFFKPYKYIAFADYHVLIITAPATVKSAPLKNW